MAALAGGDNAGMDEAILTIVFLAVLFFLLGSDVFIHYRIKATRPAPLPATQPAAA